MPSSSSVYRLSTTTTTRTRAPHSHYGHGIVGNDDDDDADDLTATISSIAPVNNRIISHSNAITPSALSTYRHYPIVRRPFNDLLLQPYWKRNAETQTTNEIASLAPTTLNTQHQIYFTNRYSQQTEPRYLPSTLARYRNYYGNDNDTQPPASVLASSTGSGSGRGIYDRTNPFENLGNSTLPSWRSATELYKIPHDTQISSASASENLSRPTYYLPSSTAIENVNQPRIHYQNQTNQFSFINEAPMQQQQQQQQPYSSISTSLQPQPSPYGLRGDGQPYHAMTSILPSTVSAAVATAAAVAMPSATATATDRPNAPFKINSNVDVDDSALRAPLSRDAANGLLAAQQSSDRWPGQPTASIADNATAKWIESRERNDYGNQVYEYAESDPDKSKINELAAASSPNDKWSERNNNFQRQQIQAQVAQLADTQDLPKYVSAELNLPYHATVYDYPPTPQQLQPQQQQRQQQQLSSSNVYAEQQQRQQQQKQAHRRLSHDNYTASKSDDDLMMAKKKTNGNEQRRYSVATHLYDYQQNYPKSEPILLPSATAMSTATRRTSQSNDWNANEMLLSGYSNEDNVKDYSSEKAPTENSVQYVSDNVRYDDGGDGGGVGNGVTQYAQSDLQQQQQQQPPQTRSDRNDNFIASQMEKLALDEPQRDVEIESTGDRNYSPNGKYR